MKPSEFEKQSRYNIVGIYHCVLCTVTPLPENELGYTGVVTFETEKINAEPWFLLTVDMQDRHIDDSEIKVVYIITDGDKYYMGTKDKWFNPDVFIIDPESTTFKPYYGDKETVNEYIQKRVNSGTVAIHDPHKLKGMG